MGKSAGEHVSIRRRGLLMLTLAGRSKRDRDTGQEACLVRDRIQNPGQSASSTLDKALHQACSGGHSSAKEIIKCIRRRCEVRVTSEETRQVTSP